MKLIFSLPSSDDLVHLLKAWRFWLIAALLGAAIGAAAYYIFPPVYRARATVNVDFHMEQAWPQNTDREQFYYLEREVRKLEEIAMSDAVLQSVASQVNGVTVQQLRSGKLQMDQPGSGGWHFFADDKNPKKAEELASAWAQAFADQVQAEVIVPTSDLEKYISVSATQTQNLTAHRSISLSVYLLVGALGFLALSALGVLFFKTEK